MTRHRTAARQLIVRQLIEEHPISSQDELVDLLGQGGMGAVYEADHLESGRRVALKALSHRLDSPEARQRFLREGRLAAAVNHPNSVYVFGTEEEAGVPLIAMELVPGVSSRVS